MSINLQNIKWLWVIIGTVVAFLIAYGSSVCVVTGYASYLGFENRGTPDMAEINAFAASSATGVTSVFIFLGTLAGGWLAGRRADADKFQNGLMVGIISAVAFFVINILGGFSLWTVVGTVLALAGGWLGGRFSGRNVVTAETG